MDKKAILAIGSHVGGVGDVVFKTVEDEDEEELDGGKRKESLESNEAEEGALLDCRRRRRWKRSRCKSARWRRREENAVRE